MDHLLLHCQFARALGELAVTCLGFSSMSLNSIADHLFAREVFFGRKVKKKAAIGFSSCDFLEYLEIKRPKSL